MGKRQNTVVIILAGLALSGCASWFPKETQTVTVARSCKFPKVAKACEASLPALRDIPMAAYERSALQGFEKMSPSAQVEFMKQHRQRILKLLDSAIDSRLENASLRHTLKACQAHVRRIRRLCQ